MEFIYFLLVIGILAAIGTVWNFAIMRKEDREGQEHAPVSQL